MAGFGVETEFRQDQENGKTSEEQRCVPIIIRESRYPLQMNAKEVKNTTNCLQKARKKTLKPLAVSISAESADGTKV